MTRLSSAQAMILAQVDLAVKHEGPPSKSELTNGLPAGTQQHRWRTIDKLTRDGFLDGATDPQRVVRYVLTLDGKEALHNALHLVKKG